MYFNLLYFPSKNNDGTNFYLDQTGNDAKVEKISVENTKNVEIFQYCLYLKLNSNLVFTYFNLTYINSGLTLSPELYDP